MMFLESFLILCLGFNLSLGFPESQTADFSSFDVFSHAQVLWGLRVNVFIWLELDSFKKLDTRYYRNAANVREIWPTEKFLAVSWSQKHILMLNSNEKKYPAVKSN